MGWVTLPIIRGGRERENKKHVPFHKSRQKKSLPCTDKLFYVSSKVFFIRSAWILNARS